ncbi:MAG: DUF1684 domain-containing protein, partial [Vicinamibacterales bacterium]
RDATGGEETYAAGRTVDPQERPDGKLSLDFNYAYGPYCQYNDNWVCTVPPIENWLRVPIRAGEKLYPSKESSYELTRTRRWHPFVVHLIDRDALSSSTPGT